MSLKVGELYADLGINDNMTRDLAAAEKTFKDASGRMDTTARLDLDRSDFGRGLDLAQLDATRTVRDIDSMHPELDGSRIGDGMDDGLGRAEGIASRGASRIGDVLTAGIAGGLAVGGAVAFDAFEEAFERRASSAKLDVRLGVSPAFAGAAGKVAGEIYGQGFGESFKEVGGQVESMSDALGGVGKVGGDEFKGLVKTSMALSESLSQDVTPAAAKLVKMGMAKDMNEAMDMILVGFQRGGRSADDFLDTIAEKAPVLREFGLTGAQGIGMILQSIDAGAPSADYLVGAFEEMRANAADGAEVFTRLGLNGQQMASDLSAGGPVASAALTTLFDKIKAIQDPGERTRVVMELFGEETTAMQGVLMSVDPSQATGRLGDFEGAAKRAGDALEPSPIEAWKRSVNENVVSFMEDSVIPTLEEGGKLFRSLFGEDVGASFKAGAAQLGGGDQGNLWSNWIAPAVLTAGPVGIAKGIFGFDTGGVVPGPIGAPQLAMVHGGETILPTHKPAASSSSASMRGRAGGRTRETTIIKFGGAEVARQERIHDRAWS